MGLGNASVYELVIDGILLLGWGALGYLFVDALLNLRALNSQGQANGRRDEVKVDIAQVCGALFMLLIMSLVMGAWTIWVPEPRRSDTALAIVLSQACFALFVLALVSPAWYAAMKRRAKRKRYEAGERKGAGK